MAEESALLGRNASSLIGALGEIIAWNTLRKKGIQAFKIGVWSFFPQGYPYWFGELDNQHRFLKREQAEFVENKVRNDIVEFDFVGVKLKGYRILKVEVESIEDSMDGKRKSTDKSPSVEDVEAVYLVEVKTGRGENIRHYIRNPMRAFSPENIHKAKALGFKVALVVVELLENWRYRINFREM
jgi:hypothetical protein